MKKVDKSEPKKSSKKTSSSSDETARTSSPKQFKNDDVNNSKDIIMTKPPISPITTLTVPTSKQLTVDTTSRQYLETQNTNLLQPSPLSTKSTASTVNTNNYQPQQRVLSASDAAQSSSFVRGVILLLLFIRFQF